MQSVNTLKHNIIVRPSFYGATCAFILYSSVVIILLLIFNISWFTFPLYTLLLVTAVYGARKAYQAKFYIEVSESEQVKIIVKEEVIRGLVSASSFYNGLFIFLSLKNDPRNFTNKSQSKKQIFVIYRDAVKESDYRLLARIINFA